MHDNWIVATALTTAALGMVGLLFVMIFLKLPESRIDDAHTVADGATLRLRGIARSVQHRANMTIIALEQPQIIEITRFAPIEIEEGSCIIVQGKKSSYNGESQLVATKITAC